MSFLDTIGNIGEALSGIPYGLNQGLTPFNTWEGIRTKDLANDRSELQLQDLAQIQAARDAAANYYGDLVNAAQTGNQFTSAKNLYGTDTAQQQLAYAQFMRSPEGQALLANQMPGSYGFDQGLLQGASQFLPTQVPDMFKQYGMAGLDQQAAGQQVGEQMLRYQLQQMNPGSQVDVVRMPGQGYVALVDGQPMDIPASLLRGAYAAEGVNAPQQAINTQVQLERAIQTGNVDMIAKILQATNSFQKDPALAQLTQMYSANQREMTSLLTQRTRMAATYGGADTPIMAQINARIAELGGRMQQQEALIQQRAQRTMGAGTGVLGAIGQPQAGSRALSFTPNGQTQVISDFTRPIPDYADFYGGMPAPQPRLNPREARGRITPYYGG